MNMNKHATVNACIGICNESSTTLIQAVMWNATLHRENTNSTLFITHMPGALPAAACTQVPCPQGLEAAIQVPAGL